MMVRVNGDHPNSNQSSKEQLSIEELRGIISGKYTTVSREKAVSLLAASDAPDKQNDFGSILENRAEHWTVRYLAATYLGRIDTPESKEILVKNTAIEDEQVLAIILRYLGRIGDEKSLDAILDVERRTKGFVALQAKFAATLISYRLNLQGNDLSDPSSLKYLTIPTDSQQMVVSAAKNVEIRKCLQSLRNDPFGIQLAEVQAYQVCFGPSVGIVLFNQDLTSHDSNIFLKRKMFAGIFAEKAQETGLYSIALLILTSPAKHPKAVNIFMTHPDGKIVLAGTARLEDYKIIFHIRSVSEPSMFPVLIEGTVSDNNLEITNSRFSSIIQNKNKPISLHGDDYA
jgi:HEAT repeats